jgi:two-component system, cell cycle response regulator
MIGCYLRPEFRRYAIDDRRGQGYNESLNYSSTQGRMRILIADDSLVSRHLLEATLRNWGYDVVVACDGTEAWKILQRNDAPNVAILDWMMPGLAGPEVCRMVRQKAIEPYTYILLLTSRSLKEDVVAGMDSGADDYLTKPFDQQELKVRLRAATRIVDLQAQLLATREALRVQATRDYLTNLWNRSSIMEILERELARSSREHSSCGVVLVDLDHFKSINDTRGHFAGDIALKETAHRMQSSVRAYDAVGRYGGEEFLLIMPGCDEGCTRNQAERIRLAICSEAVAMPESPLHLSASFGCSAFSGFGSVSADMLIRTADEALYKAKHGGRNCAVFQTYSHHPGAATLAGAQPQAC